MGSFPAGNAKSCYPRPPGGVWVAPRCRFGQSEFSKNEGPLQRNAVSSKKPAGGQPFCLFHAFPWPAQGMIRQDPGPTNRSPRLPTGWLGEAPHTPEHVSSTAVDLPRLRPRSILGNRFSTSVPRASRDSRSDARDPATHLESLCRVLAEQDTNPCAAWWNLRVFSVSYRVRSHAQTRLNLTPPDRRSRPCLGG